MAIQYRSEQPLNNLGQHMWEVADEHGFHEPVDAKVLSKALRLLLIVSEVAEALDAMRKGEEAHEHEEIADALIRLLEYGAGERIDLDAEVARKMAINEKRPYKHGKSF